MKTNSLSQELIARLWTIVEEAWHLKNHGLVCYVFYQEAPIRYEHVILILIVINIRSISYQFRVYTR